MACLLRPSDSVLPSLCAVAASPAQQPRLWVSTSRWLWWTWWAPLTAHVCVHAAPLKPQQQRGWELRERWAHQPSPLQHFWGPWL